MTPQGSVRSKRDDILNAIPKLIVEHDLDNTSMDMIAREANVGMGTIYNYFPSKEALVNELYRDLKRKVVTAVLGGYSPEVPLREQFFGIWRNSFRSYLANPDIFQFLEQYSYSTIISHESKELGWKLRVETAGSAHPHGREGTSSAGAQRPPDRHPHADLRQPHL